MRVKVKVYATLSRHIPDYQAGHPFEVEIPEDATVLDLLLQLKIPPEETKVTFVNGIIHPLDRLLKAGDEVGMFPPIAGGGEEAIVIDVWLYGDLARFAGPADQGSFANLKVDLPENNTLADLLAHLEIPSEARGITFINGQLSAMPGLQPDLGHALQDGDRVAFFHLRSMWPFQYRFGIPAIDEMTQAMQSGEDQGIRHSYGE
jgi:sulfur-carrier protein